MDKQSTWSRHNNMAAIHSKNTKPEWVVRRWLWNRGFRYRLNSPRLPGHPDLVLRKYRTCIFVNGCFWHGHADCRKFRMPKTNTEFWEKKISRNQQRDRQQKMQLARMGWHCITIWECELDTKHREATLESLEYTLNSIWLADHQVISRYPSVPDEQEGSMAAEPQP